MPEADSADQLIFRTQVEGASRSSSRGYSGDILLSSSGFTVIGYMTTGIFSLADNTALPVPNVFNFGNLGSTPLKVLARNADGKYQVPLPAITHLDGTNVSYFAWAEAAGTRSITGTTNSSSQSGYPWLDVTVPLPNLMQPDIVAANSVNLANEYVVSAVDLDFKHILSKLTFNIKAPAGVTATIVSTTCSFGADKVYQKGRFTFNSTDSVGVWGNHNSYIAPNELTPSGWQTPTLTLGNAFLLGEMLLLPQKVVDGFLTLKVTYTLTMGSVVSDQQTRTLSLNANDLLRGDNYVYTLLVNADQMDIISVRVAPWIDGETGSMPLVPGPKGDVLLLLDGNEAPYTHSDGKQYWLDASGWNNHCQIIGLDDYSGSNSFKITYNAEDKGYVIPSPAVGWYLYNHIRIPTLGSVTGDVSCEYVVTPSSTKIFMFPFVLNRDPINYGGDTESFSQMRLDLNSNGCMRWTFGSLAALSSREQIRFDRWNFPVGDWTGKSFYYATRKAGGYVTVGRNNWFISTRAANASYNTATKNLTVGYIGPYFNGTIHYLKIVRGLLDPSKIKNDFDILKVQYKLPSEIPTAISDQTGSPSNTYVINVNNASKWLKFDSRKKPRTVNNQMCHQGRAFGNGSDYTPNHAVDLLRSAINNVEVVWQTANNHGVISGKDFNSPSSYGIDDMFIKNLFIDEQGIVYVEVRGAGNAVVAAKTPGGTNLWTWHIWGTEGDIGALSPTNGVYFMDRNLAALASASSKPSSGYYKYFGAHYQWGHKDPYMGQGPSGTRDIPVSIYDNNANLLSGDLAVRSIGGYNYMQGAYAGNTTTLIENPLNIYYGNISGSAPLVWLTNAYRKTIYDPCPFGYRVPEKNKMSGFTGWSGSIIISNGALWNNSWFPCTGTRGFDGGNDGNGTHNQAGGTIHFWSSSKENNFTASYFYSYSGVTNIGAEINMSYSFAVRCVRE